jgi:catechol 2,3-dioxygenase-like lactoylglutathione lyase family enzyme
MRRGDLNLYVASQEASEQFYAAALGFEKVGSDEVSRTLRSGDVTITLFSAKRAVAPLRGSVPGMTADLLVDDLDAAIAGVEAAGGTVELVADWERGRYALVDDPDGICWELIEGVD